MRRQGFLIASEPSIPAAILRLNASSNHFAGLEGLMLEAKMLIRKCEVGTPGKIRTYDLLLRRQTLYPD
jgi:hypothetical protein